jgi:hypothetical protein
MHIAHLVEDTTKYEIFEVYYDDDGNIIAHSKNPISPYGEDDIEELKSDINKMKEALDKPVLDLFELDEMFKRRRLKDESSESIN